MNDIDDTASRRERMQALKQRRQAALDENDPTGQPLQRSIAGSQNPAAAGGGAAPGQRAKQVANLILKWMETTGDSGAETIADTGVSRDRVTKLMTLLSGAERKSGPAAKIAKMLRGFLARPPQHGEPVVDGVNTEQLRKLIILATKVRDQGPGRQKPTAKGGSRFWDGSAVSVGDGDDAVAADLDAAFESLEQDSDNAPESPADEQPDQSGEASSPTETKRQTKRNSTRPSKKK